MIKRIQVILYKEVIDNLRDRRTLAGSLAYPLIGPLLIALMFTVLGQVFSSQLEGNLPLPVIGANYAPNLVQFLEQNGVEIQPGPESPEQEVRDGNHDVVLIIKQNYQENFIAGRPATVQLSFDASRQSTTIPVRRIQFLLEAYSRQISIQRLLARGINPQIIETLAVEENDVSTPQSKAAMVLNILPYFIIFSVFIGGMYLAIDTTAGERERGSLEPLLINPVTRKELVLGKLGATLIFTIIAVVETLAGFYLMLRVLPTESLGLKISLGGNAIGIIFLITIPMMLLAAALQLIIASFTHSFKEAQNYLTFLPLIPALPGMFLALVPLKSKLWMMLIPTFGQQLLITQVMRGEILRWPDVLLSATVTILTSIILVHITIERYKHERILLGQ